MISQTQAFAATRLDPADHITQIDPLSPRRVGRSPYVRYGIRVRLEALTLQHTAVFLAATRREVPGVQPAIIRLQAPRESPDGEEWNAEEWNAEVTLDVLVFEPEVEQP